jgi:predicted nucleotidyltransferase
MRIRDLVASKRQQILEIASRHGARNIRLIGSVARGDERADSDLDLLVSMDVGRSLLDLAGLALDVERLIGRPVDVATERSLRQKIRESVLREAKPL